MYAVYLYVCMIQLFKLFGCCSSRLQVIIIIIITIIIIIVIIIITTIIIILICINISNSNKRFVHRLFQSSKALLQEFRFT